jgi:hypothetical protein
MFFHIKKTFPSDIVCKKLKPFYQYIASFCKLCKNSYLLFFLTTRLRNITTSQWILKFEVFIIFILFFFLKLKMRSRGTKICPRIPVVLHGYLWYKCHTWDHKYQWRTEIWCTKGIRLDVSHHICVCHYYVYRMGLFGWSWVRAY